MPEMPPMENSTSAGTPLATQNAPFQSMARRSAPDSVADTPMGNVTSLITTPQIS
jgi:hypothetical protein